MALAPATLAIAVLATAAAASPEAPARLEVGGAVLEVSVGPEEAPVPRAALLKWVETAARAVADYYGRFPVPQVRITFVTGGRRRVGYGTTWGGEVASIRIFLGRATTEADLADDWTLTHEMVHLGFPDVDGHHSWIEEGLATYVEPVARARAGTLPAERVWGDLMSRGPGGLPQEGDGGLESAHSRDQVYWGGALFWLMADVEIRQRSGNKRGVPDVLRGIQAEGGSIRVTWTIERCLAAGDRAAGVPVLSELYARMGKAPLKLDLDALWKRLGVVRRDGGVAFDDAAPLAPIRRAITSP